VKLDLGCGKRKHDGCIGIDWSPENSDADIIADLNNGIPFIDNSVDEIYASHFLEHAGNVDKILREIHRVCKLGAKVHIKVPNAGAPYEAFSNPHHLHFFIHRSFDFYCTGEMDFPRLFRMLRRPSIVNSLPIIRELPPFHILHFELEVVK